MKLLAVLVLAVMVFGVAYAQDTPEAEADFIESLPGQDPSATYRQYSGYFDVGDGNMLHYWFIESQNDPANDPLLLWMNGGPGCSSLDGLLTELGPFTVNDDAQTLTENPYTWNTFANIIYLEAPACVGFSYNDNGCSASDDTTAQYNYVAIQQFFERFPAYRNSAFFVTGESYGGIYVPTLSVLIVQNNDTYPINFQGYAVGNGLSSYDVNDNSLIFFANYHGLVSQELWATVVAECCEGGVEGQSTCNFASNPSATCTIEANRIFNAVYNGGLNAYSLYGDCQTASRDVHSSFTPMDASKKNLFRKNSLVRDGQVKADPPCLDYTTEGLYLNSAEVRAALHIPDTVRDWTICSDIVSLLYTRVYDDMVAQYLELAAAGVRGLVFNGDWDMACNFIGDQWFVDSLGYPLIEDHREWYSGAQVGGFVKRYELLDFMTVRGAGHMVPEDKPIPALEMIRAFVFNEEYPAAA